MLFKKKDKPINLPICPLYKEFIAEKHLLIAGATGSGKSVIINGILYHASILQSNCKFILIDPKKEELIDWKYTKHCLYYADDIEKAIAALNMAMDETERRFSYMQRKRVKFYTGYKIYVVIDELADILTVDKKRILPLIQRLSQLARAANISIIAATQSPLASILSTQFKVNFDSRLGLKTATKQDSRNILDITGCESLPAYGKAIYKHGSMLETVSVPMVPDDAIQALLIRR